MSQNQNELKSGLKQSTALCNKIIAQVTKAGESFEALIQKGIKAVIRHGEKYHDVDPAKRFVIAVQTSVPGYAVNQLIQFIQRMSPIVFEYDATKTKIVGVGEAKDDKGNLKKAYQQDDVLDKAPFILEKPLRDQNQRAIEPFSMKLYKNRLSSLEDQLRKAGDKDGRGLLDAQGKTVHKGDATYEATFNSLYNAIHQHRMMADNISVFVNSGGPAAAVTENQTGKPDTVVDQTGKVTLIKQKPKAAGKTAKAA